MSKSVEKETRTQDGIIFPRISWVGSRAHKKGKTSREKANKKCLLNVDTVRTSTEALRNGAKRIEGELRTKHTGEIVL